MVEKMDKKTNDGGQNTRKLMIEQHEPTYNKGLTEVLRKGKFTSYTHRVTLVKDSVISRERGGRDCNHDKRNMVNQIM